MLKNVAIPLMLAASEAGAQDKDRIMEAMEADKAQAVPRLIADAAACTAATNTGNDSIESAVNAESDAKQAWEGAKQKVADLIADTGAWGLADKARKEAVEAAAAQEVEEGIAGLIDTMDKEAGDERAAAKDWLAAEAARREGQLNADAEKQRFDDATDEKKRLEDAKNAAADAVEAIKKQQGEEKLAREFLYCELGAAIPVAQVGNWEDAFTLEGNGGTVSTAGAQQDKCTVPKVEDADGKMLRRAAEYFRYNLQSQTSGGGGADGTAYLSAEVLSPAGDAPYKRWTAKRHLQIAEDAADADAGEHGGTQRSAAGAVLYLTGAKNKADWDKERFEAEQEFYNDMTNFALAAKDEAEKQHNTANHVVAANPPDYTADQIAVMGLAVGDDGAKKELDRAAAVRDSNNDGTVKADVANNTGSVKGSAWYMPNARTQSTTPDEEYITDWTSPLTEAHLNTWRVLTDVNTTKLHIWWQLASDFHEAVAAWHAHWILDVNSDGKENGPEQLVARAFAGEEKSGDYVCETGSDTTNGGKWQTVTSDDLTATQAGANAAGCKEYCMDYSTDNLVADYKIMVNGVEKDYGGKTMAAYLGTLTFCGGYSFQTDQAANGCKWVKATAKNQTDVVAAGSGGGKCYGMADGNNKSGPADFFEKAEAVKTAHTALEASTGQALKDVQTEMDAQAALEQAWLEAWFLQQYWTKVDAELLNTKPGSQAKIYKDMLDKRKGNEANENTSDAQDAATSAASELTKAETALAALVSNTSKAQAVLDDLAKRILRIDAERAQLFDLVSEAADGSGTLEVVAKKRLDDFNDYTNETAGSEGEYTLAKKASEDTAALVAPFKALAGSDPPEADPAFPAEGTLAKNVREAQTAWDKAKEDAGKAAKAVEDALGDLDLATLRSAVITKSGDWDKQNKELKKLEDAVDAEWDKYVAAQKLTADRIEQCQLDAYDAYRKELKKAMEKRDKDLADIKKLLEDQKTPAIGTAGARCEKALSNGTYRPRQAQGRETVCDEGLCCGAARVWMEVGAGEKDAAWKTVETCQSEEASTYEYQPPRAPMATTLPAKVKVDFACIEGAQKLAAAASALAAAVYMLA